MGKPEFLVIDEPKDDTEKQLYSLVQKTVQMMQMTVTANHATWQVDEQVSRGVTLTSLVEFILLITPDVYDEETSREALKSLFDFMSGELPNRYKQRREYAAKVGN